MWKKIKIYVLVYLLFAVGIVTLFSHFFYTRNTDHMDAESHLVQVTYKSVVKGIQNSAELFYSNIIDRPENTRLLKQVYQASPEQQQVLRDKLYSNLIDHYRSMEAFKIKQLHFHLKNNDSFLRFHRPNKFGDNLKDIRSTVAYVNAHRKKISGFEEGRIFNGYRFVFPLYYGDDYVGSVETSVSMQTILNEMELDLSGQGSFIIDKAVVDDKVFKSEQSNYRSSPFSADFLYENSITPKGQSSLADILAIQASKTTPINDLLKPNRAATYEQRYQGEDYFLTFLPLKNAVSKRTIAYLMLAHKDEKHHTLWSQFFISTFLSLLLGAVMLRLFYKVKYNEKKLREAQDQTKHQNELLRKAQQVAHLGYWTFDLEKDHLHWSDEVYRIFGLKPQEFKATYEAFLEYVHPDDRELLNRAFLTSVEHKAPYSLEHRIIKNDGEVRYVQEECLHHLNDKGEITHSIGTVLDVTDRVWSERNIQLLKEQYQSLVQSIPEIVFRCKMDKHWTMLFMNDAIEQVTGYPASDFIFNRKRSWISVVHPDDRDGIEFVENEACENGETYEIEYRLVHKNGDIVYVKEHGKAVTMDSGEEVIEGIISDITSEKMALLKLQQFIDTQSQIMVVGNAERMTFANQSFFKFFGYANLSDFEKENKCLCDFFIPHEEFFDASQVKPNQKDWLEAIQALPGSKRIVLMENTNQTRFAFSVSINAFDQDSLIIGFNDISDTMKEHIDWKYRASHDPLTGSFNRNFLEKNYQELFHDMTRYGKLVGLILFDIDHFKNINDTYGHNRGDQVLEALAKLIQTHVRDTDRLIRWGGEEFLLLFPTDSLESVEAFANKLREQIEQKPMAKLALTCSFGGTVVQQDEKLKQAISRADKALYYAKEHGRNMTKVEGV
ncbi:diguanylate cyclase [Thiomicrorhabdus sp. ZW0627]|uniref:sensor domain-containing diguanylate cyclase n=1 Tax=Thiomicrorhabdus sp. ZW0627 TaxID=3039774 RepID=UPI002436D1A6|nr:diguanylate cyclase [Thiomicrorhabdus sp. ZW0627]MDG6773816.1 diguanylate cyclase [Thiomicrorhabdus sp. ZW0627]